MLNSFMHSLFALNAISSENIDTIRFFFLLFSRKKKYSRTSKLQNKNE